MTKILTAHVVVDSGDDFTAGIANLTPSTVFIETAKLLDFRLRVTVTFRSVSVVGMVVHRSLEPQGYVIALDGATPELRVMIEELMDDVDVRWTGGRRSFDHVPTMEHVLFPPAVTERHEFDEPTKTGHEKDPDALSAPVALPKENKELPRLRATTVVGERRDSDFVEEPTEDGVSRRE